MISTPTVFILGAGASVPFGYPTGAELRTMIVTQLGNPAGHRGIADLLLPLGYDDATLMTFSRMFEMSAVSSIDRFMAMRPTAHEIGRRAIVACVSRFQIESNLYVAQRKSNGVRVRGTTDWFGYLYDLMADGIFNPADFVRRNKVKFITFNYDIVLERLFFNALRGAFNIPDNEAAAHVRKIPIHHVYGSLERKDPNRDPFEYVTAIDHRVVAELAKKILVMPHERPDYDEACTDFIAAADRVFFLGCGFDQMNCARLGIEDARSASGGKPAHVYGTAFGLTPGEINLARRNLGVQKIGNIDLENMDCLTFLRHHADLLHSS